MPNSLEEFHQIFNDRDELEIMRKQGVTPEIFMEELA
jgi:hypothetical protein